MIMDTNLLLLLLKFINNFCIFYFFFFLTLSIYNSFKYWFYWIKTYFLIKKKYYYIIIYLLTLYVSYRVFVESSLFFFFIYTNIPKWIKFIEKQNMDDLSEFLKFIKYVYSYFQSIIKQYTLMFQFKNKKNIFNQTYLKSRKKYAIWYLNLKNIKIEYVGRPSTYKTLS